MRLPVLNCVLMLDRSLCRSIMLPIDCCCIQLVETRMAYPCTALSSAVNMLLAVVMTCADA